MAGTILTPVAIWRGFKIDTIPTATVIDNKQSGEITYTQLKIKGRKVREEFVEISALLSRTGEDSKSSAILLLRDFESCSDETLQEELTKKGFTVLSVDVAGKVDGKNFYTYYPEEISYANYENVKDKLFEVEGDANQTCWHEWAAVLHYALEYLKNLKGIKNVGALGLGDVATALWQVAGTCDKLSCACFAINAGWVGYRGLYKFAGTVEPQFSDNMYKFIAGIDAQSYATHVNCPILVLVPTNNNKYDMDRAYDTISRIDESHFSAVHYSVGYRDRVSGEAYNNCVLFFENFLKPRGKKKLYSDLEIKAEIVDGKIVVEVVGEKDDLKDLAVYCAEEISRPSLRAWHRVTNYEKQDDKYVFTYTPYPQSGQVIIFAQATYKSGFSIGSNVISKKFAENEICLKYKSNVIYTSRELGSESVFTAENQAEENADHINLCDKKRVLIKKGPLGIEGVTCEWGLLTFKINASKDMPKEEAILMFDVYSKHPSEFKVKLIADFFGEHKEYFATVKLLGGEVWHNVKLQRNKFKTEQGMNLKSYDKIEALAFENGNGEFLINNALWV